MRVLLLYSTSACHLCELAEAMLQEQSLPEALLVEIVDISESDSLMAAYGTRIPVLKFADGEQELSWPFSEAELRDFLAA